MVQYYEKDGAILSGTPGLLPAPYTWLETAMMVESLIFYQFYTGDDQYSQIIDESFDSQVFDTANLDSEGTVHLTVGVNISR